MNALTYVTDCMRDHVNGMKFREDELREEIRIKNAELKLLERERRNLELGIDNWIEESKQT